MEGGSEIDWPSLLARQAREQGRLLFRLAFGVVRDAAAAEDVCQQAFLRAWEHRERLRDPAQLRGWLARTVVNGGMEYARRRQTERRALGARGEQSSANQGGAHPELPEAVLAALDRLPEMSRTVVVLRVLDGVPGTDVKELLGCSAAEVSRQLHRGLEQLRGLLAEWQPAGFGRLEGVKVEARK